jgi:hypothetical protein
LLNLILFLFVSFEVTFPTLSLISEPPTCDARGPVKIADNYVKSFCIYNNPVNYADGQSYCLANQMRPYMFDSVEAKSALIDFANQVYKTSPVKTLFINGKSSLGCATISNMNGPYVESVGDCTAQIQTVCEYLDINA